MRCGISTATFYPVPTKDALRQVILSGAQVTEIFLNTFSELEADYLSGLERQVVESGIEVLSLHPFSSAMEGFFFATPYEGRVRDGMDLYRRYFEACERLGATRLVFHGDNKNNPAGFSDAAYAERFCRLAELGRQHGVTLCQENVVYCRLGNPGRIQQVKPLLGENAAFVLDTKQMHRAGASLADMLAAMGSGIRHVHISDYTDACDCVPPGEGRFDFRGLLEGLRRLGYGGDLVIELYSEGYERVSQVVQGMAYMNELIEQVYQTPAPDKCLEKRMPV